jgi:hypothetical protein
MTTQATFAFGQPLIGIGCRGKEVHAGENSGQGDFFHFILQ